MYPTVLNVTPNLHPSPPYTPPCTPLYYIVLHTLPPQLCTFWLRQNICSITSVLNQDAPVRVRQPLSYSLLHQKTSMKGAFNSIEIPTMVDFFPKYWYDLPPIPPSPMIPINFLVNSQFWNFLMKPRPALGLLCGMGEIFGEFVD